MRGCTRTNRRTCGRGRVAVRKSECSRTDAETAPYWKVRLPIDMSYSMLYLYNMTYNQDDPTKESAMVNRAGWQIDWLTQRTRRILAVASLIGLPAMFAWSLFWLTTTLPTIIWGPISFVLVGATAIGALILYRFVRNRADLSGTGLDERQRQLRDRAWVMSYQILSTVVVAGLAFGGILVLGLGRELTIDASLANAVVLCMGILIPLLPVAALAWVEPDPPAGD